MAQGMIMRRGGAAASGLPQFTYTGTYTLIDDGNKDWRIKFLTSGIFTPTKNMTVDLFGVGGGGAGGPRVGDKPGGGGGGGYTATQLSIVLQNGVQYEVVIGSGGTSSGTGGTTSFSTALTAFGGHSGITNNTGAGGSNGALMGNGGSNGGLDYGTGQGTTTREFGENTGDLYAGGGGGYNGSGGAGGGGAGSSVSAMSHNGIANTGGGGGGSYLDNGVRYSGGSGIVVIRNVRAAA